MAQKVKLVLSYDGSEFGGWQKQKSGPPTVQGTLEQALSRLFNDKISVLGAGRTDAGVHAINMVAHFKAPQDPKRYNLIKSLNALTPASISIKEVWEAPEDFHAIASSTGKTYKYLIHNNPIPTALRRNFTTWVRPPLDLDYLNEISQILVGKQDFKSFQTSGSKVSTTVREILQAEWKKTGANDIEFTIHGTGFLKQMVRNIVGTQLDLARIRAPKQRLAEIIAAQNRQEAGKTAPPQGLYLYRVYYPKDLDNRCRKL